MEELVIWTKTSGEDNMHHSLKAFFSGDFASVRGMWEINHSRSEPCYLEDNEHNKYHVLYWLHGNNYAASEPAGQQGRSSELWAPSLCSPALPICSAPTATRAHSSASATASCEHHSLVVVELFKPPCKTPSHADTGIPRWIGSIMEDHKCEVIHSGINYSHS